MNKEKYFKRRLKKLQEKYPITVSQSKEAKTVTKIKLGHYSALSNSKQFYEAVKKELED
jgi:uncharacterized protein YlxP (DUF503 family)